MYLVGEQIVRGQEAVVTFVDQEMVVAVGNNMLDPL